MWAVSGKVATRAERPDGRETPMGNAKKLLMLALLTLPLAAYAQQSRPQVRLMEERAEQVIERRNRMVAEILRLHGIAFETNADGVPVWIEVEGKRHKVRQVLVTPIVEGEGEKKRRYGHELAIVTPEGTLLLRNL